MMTLTPSKLAEELFAPRIYARLNRVEADPPGANAPTKHPTP
jgi:hypothetical protein